MNMEGVLPINKPAGWTSHDVVAKARRLLRMKRIGHTGTLDPEVTGVLPLCLGRATRLVEYMQDLPKEYEAVLVLGIATDTEDMTGNVLERRDGVEVAADDIERALQRFVGEIEQVPPMYSAVKVDGKRLYELAREGKEVERKPRRVTIHRIDLLEIRTDQSHPEIRFRVSCSKGTYIRTLCADLGRALGVPAAMGSLVRTASGLIRLDQCLTLPEAEEAAAAGTIADRLIPMDQAIGHLPKASLPAEQAIRAAQGQRIAATGPVPSPDGPALLRVYDEADRFLGVFERDSRQDILKPVKVFLPES